MKKFAPCAFTLIELLVVIGIIGVLTAIALPIISSVQARGRRLAEVSAARQIAAAYLAAANENDGALLPGYATLPARDDAGRELGNPIANRYPWRLAPYLNYQLEVLYGYTNLERLKSDRARSGADFAYAVSVSPALGMNTVFVGGDSQTLNPASPKAVAAYGDFCVRRLAQSGKPSALIVFASACFDSSGTRVPGYFRIEAPSLMSRRWSTSWQGANAPTATYGQVDFRHDGKALAVMLDGHVELLSFDQMNDMRRWSNQAMEADRGNFQLGQP